MRYGSPKIAIDILEKSQSEFLCDAIQYLKVIEEPLSTEALIEKINNVELSDLHWPVLRPAITVLRDEHENRRIQGASEDELLSIKSGLKYLEDYRRDIEEIIRQRARNLHRYYHRIERGRHPLTGEF